MQRYLQRVCEKFDDDIKSYSDLHRWSVQNRKTFWRDLLDYFGVIYREEGGKPLELNFAQNLLAAGSDQQIAITSVLEDGTSKELNYAQLRTQVGKLCESLREHLAPEDVLAAWMPNIPETVIAMLACSSLGGVFTSTSCDFGVAGVLDRFGQVKPKILIAATGYYYNGKYFDQGEKIVQLAQQLPSVKKIILVGSTDIVADDDRMVEWSDFLAADGKLEFPQFSFSHPLYIMYSSGTTGKPKCIVHCAGGVLSQHLKELGLHSGVQAGKSIFYFTTCGWMMWNWLVSSLFFGARVVLFEGSPGHPSVVDFFSIIDKYRINIFGTSPKFLKSLEDAGYQHNYSLSSLETILSTGAPLMAQQFDFVYQKIKRSVCLSSICGGTDILGCFMLGNPLLPVRRGEIQCLGLGMDVACFDTSGKAVIGEKGELVCRNQFPSWPLKFLEDPDGKKMSAAYFEKFPGVWHHGDFIEITHRGGVIVYGRSDATLNPGGVRIGTGEIYRQIENLDYLADSLCVCRGEEIILFVKMLRDKLTDERVAQIKRAIKKGSSPRHIPKKIYAVTDIPYTRSGKKMEMAVSRIVNNIPLDNLTAVANPQCLEEYRQYAVD